MDGEIKCVSFITVYQTETCDEWKVSDSGETTCVHKKLAWPKYSCVEHIEHNGEKVCSRMVFYKPRFICDKYEIIDNKSHCLKKTTFFGKAYHTFVCIKTGKVIKREI